MEENTNHLNGDFFKRLKSEHSAKREFIPEGLDKIISKEIKFKDLNEKLAKSKQEKVTVKEILLETEVDLVSSLKQLKTVFKEELNAAIYRVNDLYNSELLKLQKIYKSEVIGERLMDIINTISPHWCLVMKDKSVNAYKYYSPPFEVTEAITDKDLVYVYEKTVCKLKGIYVNILHPKITNGTIYLATEGQHPNADAPEFGMACDGDFDERDIPLDDSNKLLSLLNEISAAYEKVHLDSCYYTPEIKFKTKKGQKWKAA